MATDVEAALQDPELESTDVGPRAARRRRGRGRRRAPARRGRRAAPRRSPSATPARSPSWTRAGLREAMERARRDLRPGRPRRLLRAPALRRRHRRPGATARCCSASQERGDGDRDDAAVLRARVGGAATTSAPRSCSPTDGARLLPPPPAQRAPLPPAPADRARGEDPRPRSRSPAAAPGRGCSRS